MLIRFSKSYLVISSVIAALSFAADKDYSNFSLPKERSQMALPESGFSFNLKRVTIKSGKTRFKEKSVNHQQFLFAKEAFVAEKRDEAIKLLRQELDSGFKANRDNMLLRLGQLYSEKYMELSYRENELFGQQLDLADKKRQTDKNVATPKLDNSRSQKYLKEAVALFYSLEKEFPRHPKLDEVLYFIGFVEMESNHDKKGLQYMERVIRQYPQSRKYSEAVVFVGDNYFENQKFKEAAGYYRLLLKKEASLEEYALYKLAWCDLNTGDSKKALRSMKSVISKLKANQDQSKFNLREQALKDLVVFYVEAEQVEDAFQYFTAEQSREKAVENLRILADIYRAKAKDGAAIQAYKKLILEFPDAIETPRLYVGLYDSESHVGKQGVAVKSLMQALEKYGSNSEWAKSFPAEKADEVRASYETLGSEAAKVAYYYHQAAQKSANRSSYDFALKLYGSILNYFPDHPERKKIAFFRGEALMNLDKWLEASESYMLAANTPPKDKMSDEAVYNALLALDGLIARGNKIKRYSKEEQKKVSQEPQEIPKGEQKFIEVGEYYLKEYPQGDKVVDVKFRIASIYYERHHFDKALVGFKDIAFKHQKHRTAATSAHIVLDIYNIQKDYDSLTASATTFLSYKGLGDKEFRDELNKIVGEIDFKKVESVEGKGNWEQAGDTYVQFYKNNPQSALAEKSLYNAYVSFNKGGQTAKSLMVSKLFLSKYPKSEYAESMMLNAAKNAEMQYDFDEAQKLYLEFYRKFPKGKEANKSLYNAAVYAELLEHGKLATDLYEEYLKTGKVSAEEKRSVTISLAKLARKQNNWDKSTSLYRRLLKDARSTDEKLTILAELARQFEKAKKNKEREEVVNEIRQMSESRGSGKGAGAAAPYVAEAKFKAIAKQREKYEAVQLRFPPEDLIYNLKRKEKMIQKLAATYDSVLELGVPEWGVAALYEKSRAYDHFVTSFRNVKIPAKHKNEELEEIQKSLQAIDAKLVKPVETKAQEILSLCVSRAAEFHVVNDYASKCRLSMKNPSEGETTGLIPEPSYWSTRAL